MSVLLSGKEIISMAMEIEKSGRAYYQTFAQSTENTSLKELFEYLAAQELEHLRVFEKFGEELDGSTVIPEAWEEVSEYIKATTDSRLFVGEDKAINIAKTAQDAAEAIQIAIGFEKDTLLFFYEVLNVTPQKSRDAVQKIIDEEKKHVRLLSDIKREIARN